MRTGETLYWVVQTKCYGEVQLGWEECGNSQDRLPAIGLKALHEVHMYIFFIAACHIFVTIFLICAAFAQAALWKHWLHYPSTINVKAQWVPYFRLMQSSRAYCAIDPAIVYTFQMIMEAVHSVETV